MIVESTALAAAWSRAQRGEVLEDSEARTLAAAYGHATTDKPARPTLLALAAGGDFNEPLALQELRSAAAETRDGGNLVAIGALMEWVRSRSNPWINPNAFTPPF